MSISLKTMVPKALQSKPNTWMTSREIAQWIVATFPDEAQAKLSASKAVKNPLGDLNGLTQQIVSEIGAQRSALGKIAGVEVLDDRPRRFRWVEVSRETAALPLTPVAVPLQQSMFSEHDLYPKLADFGKGELGLSLFRIDETKSSNTKGKGGNKWLFPDMVGFENLGKEWIKEVSDAARQSNGQRIRLWSFEVKKSVSAGTVREAYFQAVSNSRWANLAYLVVSEIKDVDTDKELRLLSGLHGVGVILLDPDEPERSRITIPCRENPEVDWHTANRIAQENSDFKKFVKDVRTFLLADEEPTPS